MTGDMKCPDEIAQVLLEILGIGILRIRNQAIVNPEACYLEADHLHNLPSLVTSYWPELLDHYLDVERPSYLSGGGIAAGYEALWRKLLDLRQSTPTR